MESRLSACSGSSAAATHIMEARLLYVVIGNNKVDSGVKRLSDA